MHPSIFSSGAMIDSSVAGLKILNRIQGSPKDIMPDQNKPLHQSGNLLAPRCGGLLRRPGTAGSDGSTSTEDTASTTSTTAPTRASGTSSALSEKLAALDKLSITPAGGQQRCRNLKTPSPATPFLRPGPLGDRNDTSRQQPSRPKFPPASRSRPDLMASSWWRGNSTPVSAKDQPTRVKQPPSSLQNRLNGTQSAEDGRISPTKLTCVQRSAKVLVEDECTDRRFIFVRPIPEIDKEDKSAQGWHAHPALIIGHRGYKVLLLTITGWGTLGFDEKFRDAKHLVSYQKSFCLLGRTASAERRMSIPSHVPILDMEGADLFEKETFLDCRGVREVDLWEVEKYFQYGTTREAFLTEEAFEMVKNHLRMLAGCDDLQWDSHDQETIREWTKSC